MNTNFRTPYPQQTLFRTLRNPTLTLPTREGMKPATALTPLSCGEGQGVRFLFEERNYSLYHRLFNSFIFNCGSGVLNLQNFLLELGKGFAFIARQYRISLGGKHFYVDLLFYNRILKCFILIDLKKGEIDHRDIGQMNLYLNYFKKEENTEDDNEPIGIILGAYKDHFLVEYATASIDNQILLSKYQLYLPSKEVLRHELEKSLK